MSLSLELHQNLALIARAAVISERETGCPAELSTAQAILESAWLRVCPANNCFGIKDTDRYPGCHHVYTKEYISGEWRACKLVFESYPTLADCFRDHGRLLATGKPYAAAWARYKAGGGLERLVLEIAPVYATDPGYGPKILSLIRKPEVMEAIAAERALFEGTPDLPEAA